MNERNVLADTAKIVADKKTCKRKDELRKIVTEGLMTPGYDSAICKSKWEKSPTFPAVGKGQMAYYSEIKLIVKSMLAQAKSLTASIEDISLKVQVKLGSTDAKYVLRWQAKD